MQNVEFIQFKAHAYLTPTECPALLSQAQIPQWINHWDCLQDTQGPAAEMGTEVKKWIKCNAKALHMHERRRQLDSQEDVGERIWLS